MTGGLEGFKEQYKNELGFINSFEEKIDKIAKNHSDIDSNIQKIEKYKENSHIGGLKGVFSAGFSDKLNTKREIKKIENENKKLEKENDQLEEELYRMGGPQGGPEQYHSFVKSLEEARKIFNDQNPGNQITEKFGKHKFWKEKH